MIMKWGRFSCSQILFWGDLCVLVITCMWTSGYVCALVWTGVWTSGYVCALVWIGTLIFGDICALVWRGMWTLEMCVNLNEHVCWLWRCICTYMYRYVEFGVCVHLYEKICWLGHVCALYEQTCGLLKCLCPCKNKYVNYADVCATSMNIHVDLAWSFYSLEIQGQRTVWLALLYLSREHKGLSISHKTKAQQT